MSTIQSALMRCGWAVKAGMALSTCRQLSGSPVKLCDPSLTRVIPEHTSGESFIIKFHINAHFTGTAGRITDPPVGR